MDNVQEDTIKSNSDMDDNSNIASETDSSSRTKDDNLISPRRRFPSSRKPLSEAALEKLKVARVKAAEANRAKKKQRDAAKKEREEELQAAREPIVIVEQSESDSEDLEAPPGVIIVRRHRPVQKVPEKTPEELQIELAYKMMFGY